MASPPAVTPSYLDFPAPAAALSIAHKWPGASVGANGLRSISRRLPPPPLDFGLSPRAPQHHAEAAAMAPNDPV
ncbi:MAG: hypothetical protein K6V36_16500, partial [Anaerolineae bacterium]|nr:hypothetical protein [Anaerolineae bacterium]